MEEQESMLDPGDTVNNHYTVIRTIGGGAFGTVYLVNDTARSGHAMAMKEMVEMEIPPGERAEATDLFAREAEILRSLVHPGLPRIYDFFTVERSHYIVMEYIDGKTLEEKLKSIDKPFPWEKVLAWSEELCEILGFLHSQKPEPIIFRDLKPSNIMIDADGGVKLIDFGIARHFSPRKVKDTYFMGTPGFSPPEQYGMGQSDPRSDIFALGATMYHLLTKADMEQYRMKFPPISSLNSQVPSWLGSVIMKCLSVNPGERYQSISSLLKNLHSRKYGDDESMASPASQSMHLPQASNMLSSFINMKPVTAYWVIGIVAIIIFGSVYIILFHANLLWSNTFLYLFLFVIICAIACLLVTLFNMLKSWLNAILGIAALLILAAIIVPNFMRSGSYCGYTTACKSSLKNIGVAMEMYADDNNGSYPNALGTLTPNYLKTLPTCAGAKKITYQYAVNTSHDCYTAWCQGSYHTPMCPPNLPEYDAVQGLYEK